MTLINGMYFEEESSWRGECKGCYFYDADPHECPDGRATSGIICNSKVPNIIYKHVDYMTMIHQLLIEGK